MALRVCEVCEGEFVAAKKTLTCSPGCKLVKTRRYNAEKAARYRAADPEKFRERVRRYQKENREKVLERKRRYQVENRAKIQEQARVQHAADPEKRRASKARYNAAHPERVRERGRRYNEKLHLALETLKQIGVTL